MFAQSNSNERASPKKGSPPSPSYMSSEQFAAYLKDLRSSRLNRPGGARPLPASKRDTASTTAVSPSPSSRPSFTTGPRLSETASSPVQNGTSEANNASSPTRELSPGRNSMTASVGSKFSNVTRGRDYYPDGPTRPLKPSEVVPSATYIERGQRWMEKEEAVSLRKAMEDMDLKGHSKSASGGPLARPDVSAGSGSGSDEAPEQTEEERRLYEAALAEAAELVWQHENPGKERPPEPGTPYRYKPHLRKDSYAHARTASVKYGSDVAPTGLARGTSMYSMSASSSDGEEGQGSGRSPVSPASARPLPSRLPETPRASHERMRDGSPESGNSKSYSTFSGNSGYARSGLKKNIFGEPQKPFPGEKISEESEARLSSSSSLDNFAQTRTHEQLGAKPKNPLNRVQFAPETSPAADGLASSPPKDGSRYEKYEIHRNPVTQSRNPQYTTNVRPALPWERKKPPVQEEVPRKHGMEIRSDEIRQATSMKLKDRSVKLPTPSAVSDNPGRPIVSFDRTWKAPDEAADDTPEGPSRFGKSDDRSTPLVPGRFRTQQSQQPQEEPQQPQHQHSQSQQQRALPQQPQRQPPPPQQQQQRRQQPGSTPNVPVISVSNGFSTPPSSSSPTRRPLPVPAPPSIQINAPSSSSSSIPSISIPSIAVSEPAKSSSSNIPQIVLPGGSVDDGPSIPMIVTPDDKPSTANSSSSRRPLPTPGSGGRHMPARPRSHWSPAPKPAGSRATARCHECGNFIEGRFVSLAGMTERFHPQCFACYSCGTSLEALEISPEPDEHRAARLERIARRAAGEHLPETLGQTMAEDGDARLRFYCHLDWHELFAPRCKHCTTPIMGEHVVALGHHWHFGHFFCAECGDPFERGMTHIEKDGYAWCVSCQTKRTERRAPKCKKCRKAVIGQYIRALGGEWHDECFRCADCGGGFDDGQIFPREGRAGSVPGEMVVLCTGCMERELKA
ncbi:hypothetical protein QBC32DRAFT_145119 [Pseudoneurospora amorphoporcata]|uniref:LIM zinc-binding domain-containing protein n=1 Tax=Pseudoneurospora amorphoporcata TaxID=241081 RepID=A0AAN6SGE8_9PEZI|nr:hypothetical protein QBC32DRAFT_145119 [Pseudoneurospora amorphoporcata]